MFWPIKLPLSWAGKKWVLPTGVDLLVTFPDALPHGKLLRVKNIRLGSLRSLVYLKRFFQARGPPLNFTFWKYWVRGKGTGGPNLPSPVPCISGFLPFLLSFFPLAIFRLRNIKHGFSNFQLFLLPLFLFSPASPTPFAPFLPCSNPPIVHHKCRQPKDIRKGKPGKWTEAVDSQWMVTFIIFRKNIAGAVSP